MIRLEVFSSMDQWDRIIAETGAFGIIMKYKKKKGFRLNKENIKKTELIKIYASQSSQASQSKGFERVYCLNN